MLDDKYKSKIMIPSGRPPVLLESTDPTEVDKWARKIAKSGPYAMNAIMYWVRYSYGTGTKEWKVITQYLKESSKRLGIQYIPNEGDIKARNKKRKKNTKGETK